MQRFFSSRRKKKRPRLKDALAPTSAFVAVPSSPTPDSLQGLSGNVMPIAGEKQHMQFSYPKTAGQPRVSSSDTVIRQTVSYSSQNDQSFGQSSSQTPRVKSMTVHVTQNQQSESPKPRLSPKSQSPTLKPPLLQHSSKSPEIKSPRQKSFPPQHGHSLDSRDRSLDLQSPSNAFSQTDFPDEDSWSDLGYSTIKRPQRSSTPIRSLESPEHPRVKSEQFLTATKVDKMDENQLSEDDLDDDEILVQSKSVARGSNKKKEPVYSKVVKKLSHYKSERKKSSGNLPPKPPGSLRQKPLQDKGVSLLRSKTTKEHKKEAVVRFADSEVEHKKESGVRFAQEEDDDDDDPKKENLVQFTESNENQRKDTMVHFSGNGKKQRKEAASHFEEKSKNVTVYKTSSSKPLSPRPMMDYSTRNDLPMGYRGDYDSPDCKDEEYQDSAEESVTLSMSLSDNEGEDKGQAYQPYATFPRGRARSATVSTPASYSLAPTLDSRTTGGKEREVRPSSVPPTLDGIPVIKPSVIHKASSNVSDDVYIFSERLPDGKTQYFAASPVHYATPSGFTTDPKLVPSELPAKSPTPLSVGSAAPTSNQSAASYYTEVSPVSGASWERDEMEHSSLSSQQRHQSSGGGSVTVSKITKLGSHTYKDGSQKSVVSREVVSSHSSISSIEGSELENSKSSRRKGDYSDRFSKIVAGTEGQSNQQTVQELVNLLTAEKKAVDAEKHISVLMEDELKEMKVLMVNLKTENERLLRSMKELEKRREKWSNAEVETDKVNAENDRLRTELKQLEAKADRQKQHYTRKVTKLNSQLKFMTDKQVLLESEMVAMRERHSQLCYKFKKLKASIASYISLDEHKEALESMQSLVDDMTDQNQEAMITQQSTIRVQGKKNKSLIHDLTDAEAMIAKLKEENRILRRTCMATEEKVINVQMEIEQYKDNEVALHQQLAKLVTHAEKTMADKNTWEKLAEAQRHTADKIMASKSVKAAALATMEKTMNEYEKETNLTLDKASKLLMKCDRDHQQERKKYLNEIRQLRAVLNNKHAQLSQLLLEKKKAEARLDYVYKTPYSSGYKPSGAKDLLQAPGLSARSKFVQSWT